jgi:hypothetical protein
MPLEALEKQVIACPACCLFFDPLTDLERLDTAIYQEPGRFSSYQRLCQRMQKAPPAPFIFIEILRGSKVISSSNLQDQVFMGAHFSTAKRVSSNNVAVDSLTSSEDEDRPILRIPSLRYLKKRRGSVNIFAQFYFESSNHF